MGNENNEYEHKFKRNHCYGREESEVRGVGNIGRDLCAYDLASVYHRASEITLGR